MQTGYFKKESDEEPSTLSLFFSKKSANEPTIVDRLASQLTDNLVPRATTAKHEPLQLTWPTKVAHWPNIKNCLHSTDEIIDEIRKHKILSEEKYRPSVLPSLDEMLISIKKKIHVSASDEFDRYPIFTSANFFRTFPLNLNKRVFLKKKEPEIDRRLGTSNVSGISDIFNT